MVAKAGSPRQNAISSVNAGPGAYDDLKAILALATKNGWDVESLGLISKDLRPTEHSPLTRKQKLERDRLVKSIFRRFSSFLTPPVPPDLEQSILSRAKETWLPWEREVIERITSWRLEMSKVKPTILAELNSVLG
ncbi:MAG: hypothetical protein HY913_05725 [Desulfomonile tiedjei]|nr:hypothetical protein [Desulfomonile tiedjei]